MEEKMMILKMLQDGKITAEEAQKLLEAVDKNTNSFESDFRKGERKFEEKMQNLQQKANKVAEKLGSKLNSSAEKFNSNPEKFGDDFAKRMEGFGNDIADSAVKFTDKLVNYMGNFIDIGNDKYQYKKNFIFTMAGNTDIKVDACNFAVIVSPTEEKDFLVNLYVNTSIPNLAIDEYFKAEQNNTGLSLKTQFPSRTWGKIEIMVPQHLNNLNIITTNGKCELNNISANDIESNTSNGKIGLYNCQSKTIAAVTSNGKIVASSTASAFADFSTSNGKIEIEACKFDKLDAKTSNGSIILDGINKMAASEGNYSLSTSNGKIVIELENSEVLGCMIDASTSLGSITIDLPQLNYFVDKKSLTMQSTAQIKSTNFDNLPDKIFINAHTSNSSIVIDAK